MKLKDITNFSKNLYQQGKKLLNSKTTAQVSYPSFKKGQPSSREKEEAAKQFTVPAADNPAQSAQDQSMLDSQGLANKADYQAQGRREGINANMGQRNFENHQQN